MDSAANGPAGGTGPAGAPEPAPRGLGREMAKGTAWTVSARLAVQGIGVLSTVILARLLIPADFGLVALATTFSAALQALTEFSLDTVLIQNQKATRRHYDTAWTLGICRNALLAVALAAAAGSVAAMFGDARLEPIVYVLAATTLIDGFQNIGLVDIRKQLNFRRDFAYMVLSKLGGFVVTVPLAFAWRSYWALVVGIVAISLMRLALSYAMQPMRPRLTLIHGREIMRFSKWLIAMNIGAFFYNRSDTFVIGKLAGAQALGVYTVAFEIANMATANLIAPLRRAIFPAYSKLSNDEEGLRNAFVDVCAMVALIAMPAAVGLGVVAEPLVHVMLGPKWLAAIPLMQVLAVCGLVDSLAATNGPIFLARGRPQYSVWLVLVAAVVVIPLIFVGVREAGAFGAACAVGVGALTRGVAGMALVTRFLALPPRRLMAVAYRPVLACAAMGVAVLEAQRLVPAPAGPLDWTVLLLIAVGTGIVVYPAAVAALWLAAGRPDGAESKILLSLRYMRGRLPGRGLAARRQAR